MTGDYLKMINDRAYTDTYELRRFKADTLRAYFDSPTGRARWRKRLAPWTFPHVYAETSHMFLKTFSDVVMAELDEVDVIVLRRPLAEVLKSFVELSYFGSSEAWPDWMSSPNAATSAIRCIAPDADLDQFDICIAYLVDIEARTERFRIEHPHARLHEVTLAELNSWPSVSRMFENLRIETTRATSKVLGRPQNQKHEMKARLANWTTVEYCQERIESYLARAAQLGIALPDSVNNRQFR